MEAQNILWNLVPDPHYVANPHVGSNHSRGIAVDINLVDANGNDLDMGTKVDDFSPLSHHRNLDVPKEAQKNRFILLGIMTAAGWELYDYEWWHYQLPDVRSYNLLNDTVLEYGMMEPPPHLV
jgi:D-alanyl-D-alanine dipeptidase